MLYEIECVFTTPPQVSVADGGPFGYGWRQASKESKDSDMIPFAFYFGALWTYANGSFSMFSW